ncbi:hypothetical protein PLCT2_02675 [Planctomycetaceae bacterium]|nr:hypothetical protein PLCT2_02675 [Planctomycetaceae bacterium]
MHEIPADFDQNHRGLVTVTSALIAGPWIFMAVASVIGPVQPPPANGSQSPFEIVRFVMWGFSLLIVLPMVVIYRQQSAALAAETEFGAKLTLLRGRTIVITAMAEGAALLAGVVTMLDGNPLLALPGFLPLIAWMVVGFPTRARVLDELLDNKSSLNRQYR